MIEKSKQKNQLDTKLEEHVSNIISESKKIQEIIEKGGKLSPESINDLKEKIFLLTGEFDLKRDKQTISTEYLENLQYIDYLKDLEERSKKPNQKLLSK